MEENSVVLFLDIGIVEVVDIGGYVNIRIEIIDSFFD